MKETTLRIRIGNVEQVVTTKNGRLDIEIYNHDVPEKRNNGEAQGKPEREE